MFVIQYNKLINCLRSWILSLDLIKTNRQIPNLNLKNLKHKLTSKLATLNLNNSHLCKSSSYKLKRNFKINKIKTFKNNKILKVTHYQMNLTIQINLHIFKIQTKPIMHHFISRFIILSRKTKINFNNSKTINNHKISNLLLERNQFHRKRLKRFKIIHQSLLKNPMS